MSPVFSFYPHLVDHSLNVNSEGNWILPEPHQNNDQLVCEIRSLAYGLIQRHLLVLCSTVKDNIVFSLFLIA